MEATQTNPFLRADTLFGVCQAIGDDFGFNPLWLRIPLASAILFSPMGAIATYFGLGLLVLLSRLIFPPKTIAVPAAAEPHQQLELVAENAPAKQESRDLAEAA